MSKKTILYVDDEEDIRTVVSACLAQDGYRVLTAANVAEGLKVAFAEFPDLVITDAMMPDESGFSFCKKLKAESSTKNTPVIFLTVMDEEDKAFEAGAVGYLTKPFDEAELRKTVQAILKPSDARADLDAGVTHLRQGQLAEALASFARAAVADAGSETARWARYYIGQVHHHQKNFDQALAEYTAIVTEDPGFWRAHNRMGLLFETKGDAARAIKHYQRSLTLNPQQPDIQQRATTLQKGM